MSPDKKASQKLVKVDNWGVFLLQRLQLMFAKGDFCDLTLKFQDDQELKVHKLVLNTCTKYFENDEESVYNMPEALSYSSMLPIVNFMYSGRLEFKPELHDTILETAKALNMTILIQLLNTQSSTDKLLTINKVEPRKTLQVMTPQSKLSMLAEKKLPFWKKRTFPFFPLPKRSRLISDEDPAPTRLEWPSEDTSSLIINSPSFSSISYESEPVMMSRERNQEEENEYERESVRKRRVAPPPSASGDRAKQLGESQIIMGSLSDDDDDCHFESLHSFEESDDETINDVSRDKPPKPILKTPPAETPPDGAVNPPPPKRVRFCLEDKENSPDKQPTLSMPLSSKEEIEPEKQLLPQSPAIINVPPPVTPASQESKVEVPNHAKIIAEVLKKFPDLVKNNKNIKLKITSPSGSASKTVIIDNNKPSAKSSYVVVKPSAKATDKPSDEEIDFNIAAENTTGPWICKKCGINDEPLKFENYFTFRKHLQTAHTDKIDSKICEFCGFKSSKRNLHLHHLYTKHDIPPPKNIKFPKCDLCKYIGLNENVLAKHSASHQIRNELVCNICKLSFKSSNSFQAHCVTCKPSNEVRNYICKNCNKHFRTNVSLKAHYKDCIVSCVDNSSGVTMNSSIEPVEMIEMPLIETVPDGKGDHSLVQLPPGIIVTDNTNVTLLNEEAGTLSNVTDTIPTSIGFTVLPEDHQTVILLDDNSDFFLQGNSSVVVSSENSEDYIVPEILPDNVTRLYTSGNISYAMNATSVITYPVVHVPSSLPDSNSNPLTAIPVSEASDLFISDKEITIASEVASIGEQNKLEIDMSSHQLSFVNERHNLKQNHSSSDDEILAGSPHEGDTIMAVSPDKAKDISTEWDFENEEDEKEIGDDPDKKPSRPSIELKELL